jgi:predicted amidophosphoribosyltransferase
MDLDAIRAAGADLVLGETCVGCDRPGLAWCSRCAAALSGLPRRTWPEPCPTGLPPVWTVAAYDGVVRDALVAHKEEARLALTRPLGDALALAVLGLLASLEDETAMVVSLVPVPSRRSVVRERGHDPLLRMARAAARSLRRAGIASAVVSALRPNRHVADQAGLGAAARAANLAGAFTASARPTSGSGLWVVVDDIITTGSTIGAAAAALASVGRPVAGAAVVAATRRSSPSRTADEWPITSLR